MFPTGDHCDSLIGRTISVLNHWLKSFKLVDVNLHSLCSLKFELELPVSKSQQKRPLNFELHSRRFPISPDLWIQQERLIQTHPYLAFYHWGTFQLHGRLTPAWLNHIFRTVFRPCFLCRRCGVQIEGILNPSITQRCSHCGSTFPMGNTACEGPRFPFLSHPIVFQNFLEASYKPAASGVPQGWPRPKGLLLCSSILTSPQMIKLLTQSSPKVELRVYFASQHPWICSLTSNNQSWRLGYRPTSIFCVFTFWRRSFIALINQSIVSFTEDNVT